MVIQKVVRNAIIYFPNPKMEFSWYVFLPIPITFFFSIPLRHHVKIISYVVASEFSPAGRKVHFKFIFQKKKENFLL